MTWLFPGMLWGLAACALPVLIHLLLRPRARRQVFPALRLIQNVAPHAARRQRVRHVRLLAARTAILALLAVALARPIAGSGAEQAGGATATASGPDSSHRGRVAAVFCLDDSASMSDVSEGRTPLQRAAEWSASLLFDELRFPPGSRFAAIRSSRPLRPDWSERPESVLRTLRNAAPGMHDRALHATITIARAALADCDSDLREIYLFTDLTRHAWRDPPAAAGATVTLYCCDVGPARRRGGGVQLRQTSVPAVAEPGVDRRAASGWRLPEGKTAAVEALVQSADDPVSRRLEWWIDEQLAWRGDAFDLPERRTRTLPTQIPPLPAGLHAATLKLLPDDELAADDRWFAAIEVADPAPIALVAPEAGASADSEARRFEALLAPSLLPTAERRWSVSVMTDSQWAAADWRPHRFMILIEPSASLANEQRRLAEWVQAGGTLLIVAGPRIDAAAWSPAAWPLDAKTTAAPDRRAEIVSPAAPIRIEPGSPGTSSDDFSGRLVTRFVRWSPPPGVSVLSRFSSGDLAILDATIGRGRVVWWAFSLRRDWGDLGIRAAPVLVRLHRLAESAVSASPRSANLFCDDPPPRFAEAATIPTTEFAGLYHVADGAALYAVNLRPEEFDPTRLGDAEITAAVPGAAVRVIHDPREIQSRTHAGAGRTDWSRLAALAVAMALLLECWMAARSTRSPRTAV